MNLYLFVPIFAFGVVLYLLCTVLVFKTNNCFCLLLNNYNKPNQQQQQQQHKNNYELYKPLLDSDELGTKWKMNIIGVVILCIIGSFGIAWDVLLSNNATGIYISTTIEDSDGVVHDFYYTDLWAAIVGIVVLLPAICFAAMLMRSNSKPTRFIQKVALCTAIQLILLNTFFAFIHVELGYAVHTLCQGPNEDDGDLHCCIQTDTSTCGFGNVDVQDCITDTSFNINTTKLIYYGTFPKFANNTYTTENDMNVVSFQSWTTLCEKVGPEMLQLSIIQLAAVVVIFMFVSVNAAVCAPYPDNPIELQTN